MDRHLTDEELLEIYEDIDRKNHEAYLKVKQKEEQLEKLRNYLATVSPVRSANEMDEFARNFVHATQRVRRSGVTFEEKVEELMASFPALSKGTIMMEVKHYFPELHRNYILRVNGY